MERSHLPLPGAGKVFAFPSVPFKHQGFSSFCPLQYVTLIVGGRRSRLTQLGMALKPCSCSRRLLLLMLLVGMAASRGSGKGGTLEAEIPMPPRAPEAPAWLPVDKAAAAAEQQQQQQQLVFRTGFRKFSLHQPGRTLAATPLMEERQLPFSAEDVLGSTQEQLLRAQAAEELAAHLAAHGGKGALLQHVAIPADEQESAAAATAWVLNHPRLASVRARGEQVPHLPAPRRFRIWVLSLVKGELCTTAPVDLLQALVVNRSIPRADAAPPTHRALQQTTRSLRCCATGYNTISASASASATS